MAGRILGREDGGRGVAEDGYRRALLHTFREDARRGLVHGEVFHRAVTAGVEDPVVIRRRNFVEVERFGQNGLERLELRLQCRQRVGVARALVEACLIDGLSVPARCRPKQP